MTKRGGASTKNDAKTRKIVPFGELLLRVAFTIKVAQKSFRYDRSILDMTEVFPLKVLKKLSKNHFWPKFNSL